MAISTLGWIAVGVAAWLAAATVVAVLIGRAVRLRDEQVPPEHPVAPPPPGQRSPRSAGRDRPHRS
ncbi:hypothetical protein [Pseudonocardia nigra]|uniref:hypothetical protein n=1 Tax=Pseudonocardia nigra TaxID=1921578 RepID=UPI001C5D88CF|nr:hypothetical protein [Pseudonocardia nigra]